MLSDRFTYTRSAYTIYWWRRRRIYYIIYYYGAPCRDNFRPFVYSSRCNSNNIKTYRGIRILKFLMYVFIYIYIQYIIHLYVYVRISMSARTVVRLGIRILFSLIVSLNISNRTESVYKYMTVRRHNI